MIAIYPKIIHLAKARQIESLACAVREYYGEQQAYAKSLDVWRLCQGIGIGLRERDGLNGGLARIIARDERGQFELVIERDAQICRTLTDQLLVAHLLGHGFLDLLPKVAEGEIRSPQVFTEAVVPILSSYEAEGLWKSERSLDLERYADHFALALLLPKRFILAAWQKLACVEKVARFFQLPDAVIKARVEALGATAPRPVVHAPKPAAAALKQGATAAPIARTRYAVDSPSSNLSADSSAQSRYRAAPAQPKISKPLQGISQLRQLAKKIDGSVDL